MKKFLKVLFLVFAFVTSFIVSTFIRVTPTTSNRVYADEENIVSYALSWRLNPNIPYINGYPRSTLEEIALDPEGGTDCSGFVAMVYLHFGVVIPSGSSTMTADPNGRHFTDIADAVPGDIAAWSGHVALYLGQGKIIHTNTRHAGESGRDNLIHVSIIDPELAGTDADAEGTYRFPEYFIRFVDDEALMNGTSPFGNIFSEVSANAVRLAAPTGSLVTESDLTGMPLEWSVEYAQERVDLKDLGSLSTKDQQTVIGIKDGMEGVRGISIRSIANAVLSGIGVVLWLYAIMIGFGYLFDKSNQFVDISFLSIVSFGHWVLLTEDDVTINTGKKTYITAKGIIVRIIILVVIGSMFISGLVSRFVWLLIGSLLE